MKHHLKRSSIIIVGWAVLLVGIVMIPYPGPGWLVVFVGLSILGRELAWAHRLHIYGHDKYHAWQAWLQVQPTYIKAFFWLLTTATVVVTIWLLNGYGMMNDWFDLGLDWVRSPFAA